MYYIDIERMLFPFLFTYKQISSCSATLTHKKWDEKRKNRGLFQAHGWLFCETRVRFSAHVFGTWQTRAKNMSQKSNTWKHVFQRFMSDTWIRDTPGILDVSCFLVIITINDCRVQLLSKYPYEHLAKPYGLTTHQTSCHVLSLYRTKFHWLLLPTEQRYNS